jgi:hypothetical protein
MRTLLFAAGLSLTLAAAAQAQTPGAAAPGTVNPPVANPPAASPPTAAQTPPASDASASVSPYKAGMVIKDAQGSAIGSIARVIKTPDGATTISASVDGRTVNLPASALTLGTDGGVVSSMSKAQITESTAPPT